MTDKSLLLTALARNVSLQSGEVDLPTRLCQAAVGILGAMGGALTIAYTEPHRVTLCVTDDRAARLEDLQDVLGEGPGPTAYTSGHQVRTRIGRSSPGAAAQIDARWPLFDEAARDAFTSLAMTAIPVRPHHEVIGVLTCHLRVDDVALLDEAGAQFLADAVGVALLQDPTHLATDLNGPWSSRALVHQATGMVTAQLSVRPDDALALLRAHAYARSWTLTRVAAAVVARELDFTAGHAREDRHFAGGLPAADPSAADVGGPRAEGAEPTETKHQHGVTPINDHNDRTDQP